MKTNIDKINNYINCNFKNDTEKDYIENIKLLTKLLEKEDISLSDANILLENNKLRETISYVSKYDFISENDNILTLLAALNKDDKYELENLDSIKKYYLESFKDKKEEVKIINEYFEEISQYKNLSKDEEIELCKKMENGDENAKNQLILSNLRFVVNVAKRFKHTNVPFLDLIQEGNLGLIKAVEKFDYRLGNRLLTYAGWWVKQSIQRGINDKEKLIKLPNYLAETIDGVNRFKADYLKQYGCEPSEEEIISSVNFKPQFVSRALQNLEPVSLNQFIMIDGDEKSELGEFIEDNNNNIYQTFNKVFYDEFRNIFLNADYLTQKEKEVLYFRYGFYDGDVWTLDRIGQHLNITRERVRQIEARALIKLRKNKDIRAFSEIKIDGSLIYGKTL